MQLPGMKWSDYKTGSPEEATAQAEKQKEDIARRQLEFANLVRDVFDTPEGQELLERLRGMYVNYCSNGQPWSEFQAGFADGGRAVILHLEKTLQIAGGIQADHPEEAGEGSPKRRTRKTGKRK